MINQGHTHYLLQYAEQISKPTECKIYKSNCLSTEELFTAYQSF